MKAYRFAREAAHDRIRAIVRQHRRAWHTRKITAHMKPHLEWEIRAEKHWYWGDGARSINFRYADKGKYHFEVRGGPRGYLGYYRLDEDGIEESLPRFVKDVFGYPGLTYPEVAYYNQWEDYP